MTRVARSSGFLLAAIASSWMAACGGGTSTQPPPAKTTPAVTVTPAFSSVTTAQAFSVTIIVNGNPTPTGSVTLSSGNYSSATAMLINGNASISIPAGSLSAGNDTLTANYTPDATSSSTYNSASGTSSVTVTVPAKITPAVTVTPAAPSITAAQALSVTIAVSGGAGNPLTTGTVTLSSGNYSSAPTALNNGSSSVNVPAGSLATGSRTLTAAYAPDAASSSTYNRASGVGSVTVTAAKITPSVTVTAAASNITTAQALSVTIAVNGGAGNPAATGTVTLSSGNYISVAIALSNGSASINVPAGSLAPGSNTLTATFTPDSSSSSTYNTATGASSAVTVTAQSTVTVDQSSSGPAISDQLLGMNMAAWYDPTTAAIVPAFKTAGIKAVRWPGGSWSDEYHWANNSLCSGTPNANATFSNFVNDLVIPAGVDLALTANYGTDPACTGPGDPAEAAAWITNALTSGANVSRITVGNEEYGSWEADLHPLKNDATTYANATKAGFYPAIKAANPNVLVGVSVNPGNFPAWDPIVLGSALYDFVEYHYYPQGPGFEGDTFLVQQAAQELTREINAIKSELVTAGKPDTPIYVGEIGSVYTNPGKQSTSITQALYAGQVLGELMNAGVSRATWWIGFGGCGDASTGNFSNSLYGWQNFGGYMVFSDGTPEYGCPNATAVPAGTLLPTARAIELFSAVAINGERVLTANLAGDTTSVRAYAATNNGGTALVLFNVNQSTSASVAVNLSVQSSSSSVTVVTYDKAIYDKSKNNIWAAPTTANLGAQNLPLTLTLTPWSMNVVIIK